MSDITTRAGKGSPLTNAEVDANFENLNADKLESVSQSDVTQHQAALNITESQISDLDKYTQAEVDALLASLEAYDQSLNTTDDVAFNSVQLTGGTGDQGTVSWNTDEETLDVILDGATLQVGQEIHYHVRNNTGSAIPDGTAVYATGTLGASGRITVAPYTANGTIPAKYFLGVTTEDIADGTDGKATHFGKIRGLDTSGFTDGDILYPSATTAGALTATAPTGSNVALPVAIVIHAASNGTLFVRATTLDENAYATAAQGTLADSALQSGDNVSELTNDAGYATTTYVDTAESDAVTTANAYTDTRETAITTAYQTYADQAEADAISTAAADATSKANTAESNANAYTDTAVAGIVDTAPATLDTLNELAAALGDDPNFATTVSNQIGTKLDASHDMTLTLAGDATGSATFTNMGNATLTVAVADDSHNHTIANVDGLQTALDGKVDDSQVLTNVPAGAVFTDTVYSHPTYAGDDFSVDTGPLTGATVVSDIDINVTTDGLGHVTDANGSISTRTLTLADLGYTGATNANNYSHPTYAGDDLSIDTGALSGATVISDIDINVTTDSLGHVTDANASVATRTLTPANIGAMATSHPANNITSTHLYMANGDGFVWNDTTNVMSVRKDGTDYVNIDAGNISSYANNYTHPSYAGDDINLDTGALSGATVISDLDFNVTTDTQGHVTDANATYSTRNLTLANLGFTGDSNANYFTYSHPSTHAASMITTVDEFANSNSTNVQDVLDDLDAAISGKQAAGTYNTIIGTDSDINTSGATIIDNLYMTDGVITSHGTRTLTLSDLGAGSLASLSSVGAAQITDNSVGAAELNVSGNGTAGQALTSDGDGSFSWADAGGGAAPTVQQFTSSGTWTKPAGCNKVWVTVVGGGGSGGRPQGAGAVAYGGGGGGGGHAMGLVDVSAVNSVAVTVGAGGTVPPNNNVYYGYGNNGGTSSFGSYMSATGGMYGQTESSNSNYTRHATGGIGSGGQIQGGGETGEVGTGNYGGTGGTSIAGRGGYCVAIEYGNSYGSGTAAANSGSGFGGGGGGSLSRVSYGFEPAGGGSAGVVIVQEFYE